MGDKSSKLQAGRQTVAVRGGFERTEYGEQSEPLFLNSSFRFNSAEQAAARFDESEPGNIYSRFTNPTVSMFEQRLAALEGAEDCIATATGMGAILTCILGLCQTGSKVVAALQLFGATINLLNRLVAKFGVEVVLVESSDPEQWRAAAGDEAALFFLETPTNPQLEIYDIAQLAKVAHEAGALLVVDNCLCTPALQRPLKLGADVVMHSATKYIDGHGRVLGGALCGSKEIVRERFFPVLRSGGISLSPFNAWVLAKSLETLALRVNEISKVASKLANECAGHPALEKLHYPFHPDHPQADLARAQQSAGGGIIALEFKGGQETAWRFINALRMISITANFGDAKSTVTHPASTTHSKLDLEQRAAAGISDGLVRISVGLEDPADIRLDLQGAFNAVGK